MQLVRVCVHPQKEIIQNSKSSSSGICNMTSCFRIADEETENFRKKNNEEDI